MSAVLTSVNIASRAFEFDGERSGIDKRPVDHPVRIADDHVEGDLVLDTINHGGPDKAVYSYADEDAIWWSQYIGESVRPGRFGENLTTHGLDVSNAVIGEVWEIGSALLQVSQPRIPCRTFAQFWQRAGLVKEFTDAARPGAYLRIVRPGEVRVGDRILVSSRPCHGLTVAEAFRARTGERALVPRILTAGELPARWHDWARATLDAHGTGS